SLPRQLSSDVCSSDLTFHKLGYDLIKAYYEGVPVVTNENTLSGVVTTYLQKDLFNDTNALQAYIQYVACYMNIPEDYDHYGSLGEKPATEKGIDFVTLREKCEPLNMVANAIHDTLKAERVKSVEEHEVLLFTIFTCFKTL